MNLELFESFPKDVLFGTPDEDSGWREGCVDNRAVSYLDDGGCVRRAASGSAGPCSEPAWARGR